MAITDDAEYCKTKEEYKDCILFYRLGDFYEMFFDDALTCIQGTGDDTDRKGLRTGRTCADVRCSFSCCRSYINRLIERA